MKKLVSSIVAAIILSTCASANEDFYSPKAYVGAGYTYIFGDLSANIDGDSLNADLSTSALSLFGGVEFNKYLAGEIRYSTNINDLDIEGNINGQSGEGDIDADVSNLAIYLKPMIPLSEELKVYGLLGYGSLELEGSSEGSFQWGFGASYSIDKQLSIFVDYVNLYDESESVDGLGSGNLEINSTNFGINYKF